MARRIRFRKLHGVLLLDKPAGLSSSQALQQVRRLFRAEKGGHTGSLDPLATGLLPLCFGEATKIAGLLLGARKAYETTAYAKGFLLVSATPLTRSSHHAGEDFAKLKAARLAR